MKFDTLSEGLRNVLSTRGITYKEIANYLGMSESGVKKMLTAEDISYNKLTLILDFLDLEMTDLEAVSPKVFKKLSASQEAFFEKHPKHFNFFVQLQHFDLKVDLVKKANNKLSKEKIQKYLADLTDQGVVQMQGDVLHSTLSKAFSMSEKLAGHLRQSRKVLLEKLDDVEKSGWKSWMYGAASTYSLTQKSALEFRNQLSFLMDEFSARSDREKKMYDAKDLVNTGALLVHVPLTIQEAYPVL